MIYSELRTLLATNLRGFKTRADNVTSAESPTAFFSAFALNGVGMMFNVIAVFFISIAISCISFFEAISDIWSVYIKEEYQMPQAQDDSDDEEIQPNNWKYNRTANRFNREYITASRYLRNSAPSMFILDYVVFAIFYPANAFYRLTRVAVVIKNLQLRESANTPPRGGIPLPGLTVRIQPEHQHPNLRLDDTNPNSFNARRSQRLLGLAAPRTIPTHEQAELHSQNRELVSQARASRNPQQPSVIGDNIAARHVERVTVIPRAEFPAIIDSRSERIGFRIESSILHHSDRRDRSMNIPSEELRAMHASNSELTTQARVSRNPELRLVNEVQPEAPTELQRAVFESHSHSSQPFDQVRGLVAPNSELVRLHSMNSNLADVARSRMTSALPPASAARPVAISFTDSPAQASTDLRNSISIAAADLELTPEQREMRRKNRELAEQMRQRRK